LPKDIALAMFKPFVLREMITRGIAPNVKSAKNMLERRPPEVFDILDEITHDHPVLLNRAPTLHKLSIQAFYPVLIEGSAIRIHPAICSGFNADFDGDQMAVHVPLSQKAIKEAAESMLPEQNLLKPSSGSPVTTPASKEMALGVYYLTSEDNKKEPFDTIFANTNEAILAYQIGKVDLRQKITVRLNTGKIVETTPGRIFFNEVLPEGFEFVNEAATSETIKRLLRRNNFWAVFWNF
jgi:DNA-directed RNA polymerase subunit beta'